MPDSSQPREGRIFTSGGTNRSSPTSWFPRAIHTSARERTRRPKNSFSSRRTCEGAPTIGSLTSPRRMIRRAWHCRRDSKSASASSFALPEPRVGSWASRRDSPTWMSPAMIVPPPTATYSTGRPGTGNMARSPLVGTVLRRNMATKCPVRRRPFQGYSVPLGPAFTASHR
jgi:hypothetical protein